MSKKKNAKLVKLKKALSSLKTKLVNLLKCSKKCKPKKRSKQYMPFWTMNFPDRLLKFREVDGVLYPLGYTDMALVRFGFNPCFISLEERDRLLVKLGNLGFGIEVTREDA